MSYVIGSFTESQVQRVVAGRRDWRMIDSATWVNAWHVSTKDITVTVIHRATRDQMTDKELEDAITAAFVRRLLKLPMELLSSEETKDVTIRNTHR